MKKLLLIMVIFSLALVGCAANEQTTATTDSTTQVEAANQTTAQSADQLPQNMSLDDAAKLAADDDSIYFIDVRTAEEYGAGHAVGAQLLPLDQLEAKIGDVVVDKAAKIIVYCRSGNRSGQAQRLLNDLGYNNVCDAGGIINYSGEIEK